MDLTQINALQPSLAAFSKNHNPFTLQGYSSTAGEVADLTVRFCGRDGYLLLLEDTLRVLLHGLDYDELQGKFPEAKDDLIQKTVKGLIVSIQNRLDPEKATSAPERAPIGDKLCEGLYALPEGFAGTWTTALIRIRCVKAKPSGKA